MDGLSSRIRELTDLLTMALVKEVGYAGGSGMQMTTHLLIHAFIYSRSVYWVPSLSQAKYNMPWTHW